MYNTYSIGNTTNNNYNYIKSDNTGYKVSTYNANNINGY